MNAQTLRQVNGDFNNTNCRYESDQMERLIKSIDDNTNATAANNNNYKHMTKYLLYVVCIIALGQKVLDTVKNVWGDKDHAMAAGAKQ